MKLLNSCLLNMHIIYLLMEFYYIMTSIYVYYVDRCTAKHLTSWCVR